MIFTEKIEKWRKKFKQRFFTYSDGFYHLPYNGISPLNLVESFDKLPFVKHLKERQYVGSNNPFCKGGFYYYELEDGCWILYSKMHYKANVAFDLFYEDMDDVAEVNPMNSDEDFYMLSLNNTSNPVHIKKSICKNQQCFPNYSWTFFKPKERNCDLNFKGADSRFVTFFFNEKWLRKNLMTSNNLFAESKLDQFIQSDKSHIVWAISAENKITRFFTVFDEAMNLTGETKDIDRLKLKFTSLELMFELLKLCGEENIVDNCVLIEQEDKNSMNRLEHYLSDHLLEKFPGIEALAIRFHVSETKLKNDFKQLFGEPVYRYFKNKQMQLAKELLLENQLIIKEVAYKLGYENSGKFSSAFKKYHGNLPSDL